MSRDLEARSSPLVSTGWAQGSRWLDEPARGSIAHPEHSSSPGRDEGNVWDQVLRALIEHATTGAGVTGDGVQISGYKQ